MYIIVGLHSPVEGTSISISRQGKKKRRKQRTFIVKGEAAPPLPGLLLVSIHSPLMCDSRRSRIECLVVYQLRISRNMVLI